MTGELFREPRSRGELIVIGVITFAALFLRFYRLADWPLYGDEQLTQYHISVWDRHIAVSPLSYIPVWLTTKAFGDAPIVWRLWPFLVGIVTVPLLYVVIRQIAGRTPALWVAGLIALAPWHIAQSQFARHYPLQALLAALCVWATYRAVEEDSARFGLLSALFGYLAVFTRPSSLYLMFVVFAYVFIMWVWPSLRPKAFSYWKTAILVAAQAGAVAVAFLLTSVYGEGSEPWGHSPVHVILTNGYYLTLPVVFVAIGVSIFGFISRNRFIIAFSLLAFVPIAMISATAMFRSATGMAAFLSLPGFLVLAGWVVGRAIDDSSSRQARWFPAIIGLALVGAFLFRTYEYFTVSHGNRSRVDEAMAFVAERRQPLDVVFFKTDGSLYRSCHLFGHDARVEAFLNIQDSVLPAPAEGEPCVLYYTSAEIDGEPKLPPNARTWFVNEDFMSNWDVPDPNTRWLNANARLVGYLPSYIGPRSRSLWIYLYTPPSLAQDVIHADADTAVLESPR